MEAFSVPPAWTWRGDSYWLAEYTPWAIAELVNPVLNPIAFKVLPNTVGATPFDDGIIFPWVGVGVERSSVQLKEAPAVLVSIVTLMSCPGGPVLLGGVSVGVAHCVTALFFSQADRNVSAMPAQIILVSIFICFLCLCEQAFRSRLPCEKRVRWSSGSSLTDLARLPSCPVGRGNVNSVFAKQSQRMVVRNGRGQRSLRVTHRCR
jgi:hypothetical protein